MSDISQWSTKEPENVKLDDLTLSGESGLYVNKVMCAVRKKFNSVDATNNNNTTAIGSWTDTTRTDSLKDAVEDLETAVESIVTTSMTVDAQTLINTDDVLHVADGLLNWQKTGAAGAVPFYPVPGVTLEPVVEFAFTETDPASGTKGLDNPSSIEGVSSITVTHCESEGVDETDYTIALGNTYYGGSVDFKTGLMTVTWWGHVFDGTETPDGFEALTSNGRCAFNFDGLKAKGSYNQVCSHLVYANNANDNVHFYVNYGNNVGIRLFAPYLTQESFMSWLADEYAAGTPVTVACEIKTPFTVQLSPVSISALAQADKYTPRLNTIYTDASAVQVGYIKSPIRSEYELTQAVIATQGGE